MCCVVGVKVTAGAPLLDVSVTTEPVRSPVTKDCELAVDPASFEYRDTKASSDKLLPEVTLEVVVVVVTTTAVCAQPLAAVRQVRLAAARTVRIFLDNIVSFLSGKVENCEICY